MYDRRARLHKTVNLVLGGAFALVCAVGLGLAYVGMQKKVATMRKDPRRMLDLLARAQRSFRYEDRDKDGLSDYARSLEELAAAGLVSEDVIAGEVEGYRYSLSSDGVTFELRATPMEPSQRHYLRDHVDYLWCADGRPATPQDRQLEGPR